jgi:hypothetical protein
MAKSASVLKVEPAELLKVPPASREDMRFLKRWS